MSLPEIVSEMLKTHVEYIARYRYPGTTGPIREVNIYIHGLIEGILYGIVLCVITFLIGHVLHAIAFSLFRWYRVWTAKNIATHAVIQKLLVPHKNDGSECNDKLCILFSRRIAEETGRLVDAPHSLMAAFPCCAIPPPPAVPAPVDKQKVQ